MIHLTFLHSRGIFRSNHYHEWINRLFPNAKFDSRMWGNWYPTIKIPYSEFRNNYKNIPDYAAKKIAAISTPELKEVTGKNIVILLTTRTHPVNKITNLHPHFEKYTGRECYGESVEEIIDIPFVLN